MKYLTLLTILVFFLNFQRTAFGQEKIPVIIDADTGNEVDDYYALSRALIEPSWDILALNATQWQASHWAIPHSMENSHRLNQVLLNEMGVDVKTRRGGIARMFDWGDLAQHSAASYEIIQQAQAMPQGEKLTIIALGALTNVASAIYIDPSIESKIKLYWLGTTYDFEADILKKQDFNCVMDVQALEVMLMSDVEMHVIPINVAVKMEFDYQTAEEQLRGKHPLGNILQDRWYTHLDGGRKKRILWDLGLIQAIIFPEWATPVEITTSKENGSKTMTYYKDIDADKMKEEFYKTIQEFIENNSN